MSLHVEDIQAQDSVDNSGRPISSSTASGRDAKLLRRIVECDYPSHRKPPPYHWKRSLTVEGSDVSLDRAIHSLLPASNRQSGAHETSLTEKRGSKYGMPMAISPMNWEPVPGPFDLIEVGYHRNHENSRGSARSSQDQILVTLHQ
jgi:hypothetical protein